MSNSLMDIKKYITIPTLYSTTIVLPNLFSIDVVYDEFLLLSYDN